MRGRLRIKIDLDPVQVYYEYIGPLTQKEVLWLAKKSQGDRRRYLASIYGSTTSSYAHGQFRRTLEALKRKGVTV